MELRPNRVKRKLEAGEPAFIAGNFTHADDIDSFGPNGFDGIWLEGEHGSVDAADLGNLTRACDIWGMTSVVRVNQNEQALIYRTLDRGAQAKIESLQNECKRTRRLPSWRRTSGASGWR